MLMAFFVDVQEFHAALAIAVERHQVNRTSTAFHELLPGNAASVDSPLLPDTPERPDYSDLNSLLQDTEELPVIIALICWWLLMCSASIDIIYCLRLLVEVTCVAVVLCLLPFWFLVMQAFYEPDEKLDSVSLRDEVEHLAWAQSKMSDEQRRAFRRMIALHESDLMRASKTIECLEGKLARWGDSADTTTQVHCVTVSAVFVLQRNRRYSSNSGSSYIRLAFHPYFLHCVCCRCTDSATQEQHCRPPLLSIWNARLVASKRKVWPPQCWPIRTERARILT